MSALEPGRLLNLKRYTSYLQHINTIYSSQYFTAYVFSPGHFQKIRFFYSFNALIICFLLKDWLEMFIIIILPAFALTR